MKLKATVAAQRFVFETRNSWIFLNRRVNDRDKTNLDFTIICTLSQKV